jgi:phosphate transport system permease protein
MTTEINLKKKSNPRTVFGLFMTGLTGLFLVLTILPLFAVLFYVSGRGLTRLSFDLFTKLPPPPGLSGGGIGNAIQGTIIVVGIAAMIAVPIGIMVAVYLSEFSGDNQLSRWVKFSTDVLSGVPSIIAGIFSYGLIVATTGTFSAVAGGIALSILMIPTIIRTTTEAFQIVPQDVRAASVGIGASNYQTVLRIVIPAALPAILTGVTLAVARASGETAPLIFTALNSPFWFKGIWEPTPTLAVLVYNFAIVPFNAQKDLAWSGALMLVFLVLLTSVTARLATRQRNYQ